MNFIKNMNIIEQACEQFVEPHPCFYNVPLQINPLIKNYPHLTLQTFDVELSQRLSQDIENYSLKLNMLLNKRNAQNCLIYLHGLSSYCLEGKFLIPYLADSLSLCLYDSRAHGKSKQKLVTYGLLQSQELYDIVRHLIKRGFKNIVLWGRSMGAVTCLKLLKRLKGCRMIENVKYVVADSPFCSFKTIATEIVSKKAHLPEFISRVFADAFVQRIKQKHGIDLNLLDLEQLLTVVPVNILYSSKDELMSQKHIENIVKDNWQSFQVNDIQVQHNQERPNWIISKIIAKIKDKLYECKRFVPCFNTQKKRGLSITKLCEQQPLFHLTPTTFSASQINCDSFNRLAKKNNTKRQIRSEIYGEYKQNKGSEKGRLRRQFNGELGGSKVKLISNRLLPPKDNRKITVSQFFIQTEARRQ